MLKQSNHISHPLYISYIAGSTVFRSHAINTHTKTSVTQVSCYNLPHFEMTFNTIYTIACEQNQYMHEHSVFINSHQLFFAKQCDIHMD